MRASRLHQLLLLAGFVVSAFVTARAAEPPIKDFLRLPTLINPVISPDGKFLAVAVSKDLLNPEAQHQLAVLQLPSLKVVSRLDLAPRFLPANIHWVSNTRLVMGLARETGPLVEPTLTGDIVAVDYDGSHKKTLYSLLHRGGTFAGANSLDIPQGIPTIAGVPRNPDGHFYIKLDRNRSAVGDTWNGGITTLYNVDAASGHAVPIGEIEHGGMSMLEYGNVARVAAGMDNQLRTEAFSSTDGHHWTRMPGATVGKVFEPLTISADGKHLYALSSLDGGPNALIVCNLDGSQRRVLASDTFSSVTSVNFNPQTNEPVAAIFGAVGRPKVEYVGDGVYAQILRALAAAQPGQLVTLEGSSADGNTLLLTVDSDRNPGDVALFNKQTMHAQPLYKLMPWIGDGELPQRTPIRFRNRSGVELAGFLTLPRGQHKDLPLVLIPHGGPIFESDDWAYRGNLDAHWAALLASRGYASLQINYRGSSGRGYNFLHAGYKQFGTGIQDDLIDGVKWAIAQGYADPKRICVFGGSFGGYSSLMQPILAPKLYQCAIDYAGVYDWRIGMDKSDTRRTMFGRDYFTAAIGSRDDAYAMSPVSMMDKFNVPVLIAHGKDDPRVPFQNATDLRSYLDKTGKTYEWLAEPGERHGFASEQHNLELWHMILPFLAKHIGPGKTSVAAPATSAPK